MHMNIFDFLNKHGIEYHNKKLIEQAFIHSSYVNEHKGNFGDNEDLNLWVMQFYRYGYQIKSTLSIHL